MLVSLPSNATLLVTHYIEALLFATQFCKQLAFFYKYYVNMIRHFGQIVSLKSR